MASAIGTSTVCAQYRTTTTSTHPANVTHRLSVFDVSSIRPDGSWGRWRRTEGQRSPASICVAAESKQACCRVSNRPARRCSVAISLTKNCVPSERAVERCVDRRPRDVYGRRSRPGRRPNCPSDSSPAPVEPSAAAEQQHHEDDDEQCGRVHFLSRVFGERGPASSRPRTLAKNDGDSALAVRITPTSTWRLTAVQAGVCSLLNTLASRRVGSSM